MGFGCVFMVVEGMCVVVVGWFDGVVLFEFVVFDYCYCCVFGVVE